MQHKDVLVCFDCNFRKAIKTHVEALVITRNHNAAREIGTGAHVMRILRWDELQSVNSLPYYDGKVYRAICACGDKLDRKTKNGIEYAIQQHQINQKVDSEIHHEWEAVFTETDLVESNMSHVVVMDRKEFSADTKDPEVKYWEAYHRQDLSESDIAKTTALTPYDPNISWSNNIRSFNNINKIIFDFIKLRECPGCRKNDCASFRDLYWHYYRDHYNNPRALVSRKKIAELFSEREKLEFNLQWVSDSEIRYGYPAIWNKRIAEITKILDETSEIHYGDQKTYRDVVIAMLQEIVMVEQSRTKNEGKRTNGRLTHGKTFSIHRFSNALYQLNRKHGISYTDLQKFLEDNDFISYGYNLGSKLFHGMIWSENQAPKWLDNVIKELGSEIGI